MQLPLSIAIFEKDLPDLATLTGKEYRAYLMKPESVIDHMAEAYMYNEHEPSVKKMEYGQPHLMFYSISLGVSANGLGAVADWVHQSANWDRSRQGFVLRSSLASSGRRCIR